MVHLQFNGFIGDNLFQYVAARIVAEELGYALGVSYPKLHPSKNVPILREFFAQCHDAPLELPGQAYDSPVDLSAYTERVDSNAESIELRDIIDNQTPRRIDMRGCFQRYSLIRPYKATVRSWLAMEPMDCGYRLDPQDIVLHIRRGDMVVFDLAMSMRFYTTLLRKLGFNNLYVVGVGIDPEVRAALQPYDPIYVAGSPVQDFRFMLSFNRMIQSNSGFAWWAGFLSGAQEIYSPLMEKNTRTEKMSNKPYNLRVDDEPRYIYIDEVPFLERDFQWRDVLSARGQLRRKRLISSLMQVVARRNRPSR